MILHMSRGFVLGVLATVFVVGGAAGYLVRGSASGAPPSDDPPLARGVETPIVPAYLPVPAGPKGGSKTTAALKSVPTPGGFYRLAEKETLSDVAKRAYGSTRRLADLLAVNASLDPKRLAPGTLVYVPVGIEPSPMPPADLSRPEAPRPTAKAPAARAPTEPAPLFAKPR